MIRKMMVYSLLLSGFQLFIARAEQTIEQKVLEAFCHELPSQRELIQKIISHTKEQFCNKSPNGRKQQQKHDTVNRKESGRLQNQIENEWVARNLTDLKIHVMGLGRKSGCEYLQNIQAELANLHQKKTQSEEDKITKYVNHYRGMFHV